MIAEILSPGGYKMSTQSGYKINNSQTVKSCKIKRSEADNLYKTLTGLIHIRASRNRDNRIRYGKGLQGYCTSKDYPSGILKES